MRIARLFGAAALLVATAIVGGTLIGGVLAAPSATSSPGSGVDPQGPAAAGEYCDVYLDTLASELGVSRDALLPASQAAAIAAIDAAVADGTLDEDRAATMKERIDAIGDEGCAFVGGLGHAFARGKAHGFMHADVLDAAASAMNLDSSDLIARMADGTSLEEIAGAEGVAYDAVKTSVIDAVQADLDAAVAQGMDQDRADAALERVQAWLDDGGQPGPGPMGGPGMGRRGGPWH
ncbi:MAG TPA: hypothetical protein VF013_01355 [Candidatus Limnocylindria bacterium]